MVLKGILWDFGIDALYLRPQSDELVNTISMSVSSMKDVGGSFALTHNKHHLFDLEFKWMILFKLGLFLI